MVLGQSGSSLPSLNQFKSAYCFSSEARGITTTICTVAKDRCCLLTVGSIHNMLLTLFLANIPTLANVNNDHRTIRRGRYCSNRQKPKYLRLQWTMQDLMCSSNPLALLLKIDGIREMGVCCNVRTHRLHAKTNRSIRLALPMHLYSVGTQKAIVIQVCRISQKMALRR